MTTNRTPKPKFVLHLEAEPKPDGSDRDGTRRLRAILKLLLRGYRFRCRWITRDDGKPEVPDGEGKPDA